MNISIITDSLSMPRVEGEDCIYINQTWPKLLQKTINQSGFTFAEFPARARDSDSLNSTSLFSEAIEFCNPKIVIIQIGIVDCAPRIISKKEYALLNKYYFPKKLKNFIIKFRKTRKNKILSRGVLKKVYVSPLRFVQNFNSFINRIKNFNLKVQIIIIPILGYTPFLDTKSNGYSKNIKMYNRMLIEISKEHNCILLSDLTMKMDEIKYYTSDGYHLNQLGQSFLSVEISEMIRRIAIG
jgi:lysophospholipase L1-like esterase